MLFWENDILTEKEIGVLKGTSRFNIYYQINNTNKYIIIFNIYLYELDIPYKSKEKRGNKTLKYHLILA